MSGGDCGLWKWLSPNYPCDTFRLRSSASVASHTNWYFISLQTSPRLGLKWNQRNQLILHRIYCQWSGLGRVFLIFNFSEKNTLKQKNIFHLLFILANIWLRESKDFQWKLALALSIQIVSENQLDLQCWEGGVIQFFKSNHVLYFWFSFIFVLQKSGSKLY